MDFPLLSKYGISYPRTEIAPTRMRAVEAAEGMGYPVALKISSSQVLHKTDRGGVLLGLKNKDEVQKGHDLLIARFSHVKIDGIIVQRMAGKESVELIIGGKRDAQFGQLIMLGMGGIFVEVMRDVVFRVCPITRKDAQEMICELRAYPILAGARGRKPVNKSALVNALVKVSALLEKENPAEFDINPLMADEKGCVAVDMRILK
ncbi:MAG: acetate--CoA ligase family protein [Candidatus Micrarchaeota archaeon]|nr:acetate--CoA ligase family protein [Candidatus Micrarchaeota archaeon]